jgi:curved DNA-binding protein CbpA
MHKLHTHYDNLKVTRNAPVEVIRAAYRAMAQKYHPDINSSPAANNNMRLLNEAWEVLSDPLKRAAHDKWILEEDEKQKKQSLFNATNSKEQVFENGNFKFHFEMPPKDVFRKKQKPQGYYEKFKEQKKQTAQLTILNAWLRRKDVQLKAIAVVVTVFCGVVLWQSIESHRNKKAIEEINARAATWESERSSDLQVTEDKPLRFVPLSEFHEKISSKKEKVPDFSNLGRPVQSESKKAVDPERQERTGYVKGAYQQASAGLSNFTVDNQRGGGDAIARIYLNGVKPASRSMYVKASEKFTARGLPPGSYVFRYRFIGSPKTYEADRLFPLEETSTSEGTRFSNVTVTLFTVIDGNLQTKEVPEEKF